MRRLRGVLFSLVGGVCGICQLVSTAAAEYTVERVATGFDRPLFVTQPPGINDTLFVLEQRIEGSASGRVGQIVALDLNTREQSSFLQIEGISADFEGGLHGMAFHPDYVDNGLLYVSWIEYTPIGPDASRLDEYRFDSTTGDVAHSRMLFRAPSFESTYHQIDWVGFDPTATGDDRDYLYATIGDNGRQANHTAYTNVAQDLASPFGKVLRIDVSPEAADAYPADPSRNFAIPADNPYANDADDQTLGEVYHSGLRNPWRASFDSQTGDLYIGNVGHNNREEIELARAGESGIDFGWARREGTITTPVAGVGGPQGASRNPFHEISHPQSTSVTGGYVYRGPIAEFAGSYIFADAQQNLLWIGEPDVGVAPEDFDGTQLKNIREVRREFEMLATENAGERVTIDTIVSFGEDNAGNLYIVDFGNGFSPQFGTGQLLRLVPVVNFADGDYDQSGTVEQGDLDLVLLSWGQDAATPPDGWLHDLPTGQIDQDELDKVLLHWGNTSAASGAASVPEPAAWLLALSAAAFALCRRRTITGAA
jgi:hypothetical protein